MRPAPDPRWGVAAFWLSLALLFLWAAWPYLSVWWGQWDLPDLESISKQNELTRQLR